MDRRTFVSAVATFGTACAAGCLGSTACDESSNHLYIENALADEQAIDVRVRKASEGLLADGDWTDVYDERVDLPGKTHRVVEGLYDEHGTYRTVAECRFDELRRGAEQRSEIDRCQEQSVAIGIGQALVTIVNGPPDRLRSGNDSER